MKLSNSNTAKLRISIGLGLIVSSLFYFVFFPTLTPERSQKLFEEAKQKCGSELWLIVEDIGPIAISVKAPYPQKYSDAVGDLIIDYRCSAVEATNFATANSRWDWISIVLLAIPPVIGLMGVVLVVIGLYSVLERQK